MTIEQDTHIMTDVVAEAVVDQVTAYLADKGRTDLATRIATDRPALEKHLVEHAEAVYANNEKFRKDVRSKRDKGCRGRDTLYAFMRHWLASEMRKKHREALRLMPAQFSVGAELQW